MWSSSSTATAIVLNLVIAFAQARSSGWDAKRFKTLVTFGDSYTDENRLGYFINNKAAPPVGWVQPVGTNTASGGLTWPRIASTSAKLNLFNYAVSGAVCSNQVTPRFFSAINAPFPDVAGYEVPAFIADSKYRSPNGTKFFKGTAKDTAYAIWIGTNDLGNNAFLTDSQVKGKTLVDYVDCVYSQVDRLYKNGGRYFVLLNLAPLQLLPQYAVPENGGLAATQFYPDKGPNITEISWRMYESVATVNGIYEYRTPFDAEIARRWPGAKMANFDVNTLITDIWNEPGKYFQGTVNKTGVKNKCDTTGQNCVKQTEAETYLWYDELHPSEAVDRVIAREFVGVLGGRGRYATYWG